MSGIDSARSLRTTGQRAGLSAGERRLRVGWSGRNGSRVVAKQIEKGAELVLAVKFDEDAVQAVKIWGHEHRAIEFEQRRMEIVHAAKRPGAERLVERVEIAPV